MEEKMEKGREEEETWKMSVGAEQHTSGVYDANLQYLYNDILLYG